MDDTDVKKSLKQKSDFKSECEFLSLIDLYGYSNPISENYLRFIKAILSTDCIISPLKAFALDIRVNLGIKTAF